MSENTEKIVVYNSGEIELNVSVEEDTIWLTQKLTVKKYLTAQKREIEKLKEMLSIIIEIAS